MIKLKSVVKCLLCLLLLITAAAATYLLIVVVVLSRTVYDHENFYAVAATPPQHALRADTAVVFTDDHSNRTSELGQAYLARAADGTAIAPLIRRQHNSRPLWNDDELHWIQVVMAVLLFAGCFGLVIAIGGGCAINMEFSNGIKVFMCLVGIDFVSELVSLITIQIIDSKIELDRDIECRVSKELCTFVVVTIKYQTLILVAVLMLMILFIVMLRSKRLRDQRHQQHRFLSEQRRWSRQNVTSLTQPLARPKRSSNSSNQPNKFSTTSSMEKPATADASKTGPPQARSKKQRSSNTLSGGFEATIQYEEQRRKCSDCGKFFYHVQPLANTATQRKLLPSTNSYYDMPMRCQLCKNDRRTATMTGNSVQLYRNYRSSANATAIQRLHKRSRSKERSKQREQRYQECSRSAAKRNVDPTNSAAATGCYTSHHGSDLTNVGDSVSGNRPRSAAASINYAFECPLCSDEDVIFSSTEASVDAITSTATTRDHDLGGQSSSSESDPWPYKPQSLKRKRSYISALQYGSVAVSPGQSRRIARKTYNGPAVVTQTHTLTFTCSSESLTSSQTHSLSSLSVNEVLSVADCKTNVKTGMAVRHNQRSDDHHGASASGAAGDKDRDSRDSGRDTKTESSPVSAGVASKEVSPKATSESTESAITRNSSGAVSPRSHSNIGARDTQHHVKGILKTFSRRVPSTVSERSERKSSVNEHGYSTTEISIDELLWEIDNRERLEAAAAAAATIAATAVTNEEPIVPIRTAASLQKTSSDHQNKPRLRPFPVAQIHLPAELSHDHLATKVVKQEKSSYDLASSYNVEMDNLKGAMRVASLSKTPVGSEPTPKPPVLQPHRPAIRPPVNTSVMVTTSPTITGWTQRHGDGNGDEIERIFDDIMNFRFQWK